MHTSFASLVNLLFRFLKNEHFLMNVYFYLSELFRFFTVTVEGHCPLEIWYWWFPTMGYTFKFLIHSLGVSLSVGTSTLGNTSQIKNSLIFLDRFTKTEWWYSQTMYVWKVFPPICPFHTIMELHISCVYDQCFIFCKRFFDKNYIISASYFARDFLIWQVLHTSF